jgi:hypothetical protein
LYVRGVLDALWSSAFKATVQMAVAGFSKTSNDPKAKLPQSELKYMTASSTYFAPLWKTNFYSSGLQFDQYLQIISNYLDAHPEQWDKHAQDLIEAALLASLPPLQPNSQ